MRRSCHFKSVSQACHVLALCLSALMLSACGAMPPMPQTAMPALPAALQADPLPFPPPPDKRPDGLYSESEVIEKITAAAAAYRDAARKFIEVRDIYNRARAAQITVSKEKP